MTQSVILPTNQSTHFLDLLAPRRLKFPRPSKGIVLFVFCSPMSLICFAMGVHQKSLFAVQRCWKGLPCHWPSSHILSPTVLPGLWRSFLSPSFILGCDWKCMGDYCLVFRESDDGHWAMACSVSRLCLACCEIQPRMNDRYSWVQDGNGDLWQTSCSYGIVEMYERKCNYP